MKNEQIAKIIERTQAQCTRILDAAEQCFIKHGFHAASMANVAEAADMSAGLIYRYFDSKSAIIRAIIERQLERMRNDFSALQAGGCDFTTLIAELFPHWQGNAPCMSPVLYLEMTAEATRDPHIAEATAKFDEARSANFRIWLEQTAKKHGRKLSKADIAQRDFAVRCFIDGLALRAIREPKLDPAFVAASVKKFLPQLLSLERATDT